MFLIIDYIFIEFYHDDNCKHCYVITDNVLIRLMRSNLPKPDPLWLITLKDNLVIVIRTLDIVFSFSPLKLFFLKADNTT